MSGVLGDDWLNGCLNNNLKKLQKLKKADIAKRERIRSVALNLEMIWTGLVAINDDGI